MNNYVLVGNIEDHLTGALHQYTVESYAGPDGETVIGVRVNGTTIPETHPFYKAAGDVYASFTDHMAGFEDLDKYLFELNYPPKEAVSG